MIEAEVVTQELVSVPSNREDILSFNTYHTLTSKTFSLFKDFLIWVVQLETTLNGQFP